MFHAFIYYGILSSVLTFRTGGGNKLSNQVSERKISSPPARPYNVRQFSRPARILKRDLSPPSNPSKQTRSNKRAGREQARERLTTRQSNYEFHVPVRLPSDKQISSALLIKNDGARRLKDKRLRARAGARACTRISVHRCHRSSDP